MVDSGPWELENACVLVSNQWLHSNKACVLLIWPYASVWMLGTVTSRVYVMYMYTWIFFGSIKCCVL
jgi:hypothetical protein